jgi:hypothetical protein
LYITVFNEIKIIINHNLVIVLSITLINKASVNLDSSNYLSIVF